MVHGGTTGQDDVGVEILTDIDITLHDRSKSELMNTRVLHTEQVRTEQSLGTTEALVADCDDLTIGQFIGFFEAGALGGGLHLLLEVEGDVTKLLLDLTDDFTLGRVGESVTTLGEQLHEVLGKITASQVETHDGMGHAETGVDGDHVGDTITRVNNDTGDTTRGVQGKDGLDLDEERRGVESLKNDGGHLLTVGLGVTRSLSEKDAVLFRGNAELIIEGVVPNTLHIVPVGNDTMLNGVLEQQDTTLGLGIVTDVTVLLVHTDHHTGVLGATDDGGEHSTGSIVTSEAGLAHTGAVVYNQSITIFFHDGWC